MWGMLNLIINPRNNLTPTLFIIDVTTNIRTDEKGQRVQLWTGEQKDGLLRGCYLKRRQSIIIDTGTDVLNLTSL